MVLIGREAKEMGYKIGNGIIGLWVSSTMWGYTEVWNLEEKLGQTMRKVERKQEPPTQNFQT